MRNRWIQFDNSVVFVAAAYFIPNYFSLIKYFIILNIDKLKYCNYTYLKFLKCLEFSLTPGSAYFYKACRIANSAMK
jgi:hypothetical protein